MLSLSSAGCAAANQIGDHLFAAMSGIKMRLPIGTGLSGFARPEDALAKAMQLQRCGQGDQALHLYRDLLTRWPRYADGWYNVGLLLSRARRFHAALNAYQQALAHGAAQAQDIHVNRGVLFTQHLHQDAAAEQEFKAALALQPDCVPALLNLGDLEENRGNRNAALAYFERVLSFHPTEYSALARYANAQTVRDPRDPLIERVRCAIAKSPISPMHRADLGFALGKLLNDSGAYDEAFDAYAAANKASREAAAYFVPYDPVAEEKRVDSIISAFSSRPIVPSTTSIAAPVIFICGMFRSGSTLTEQVLATHPRVTPGGELDLLPNIVTTDLSPFPQSFARIAPSQIRRLGLRYLTQLSSLFPGADFVTDKRPDNFVNIGLIKTMFPTAKIVNTLRHPLDNALSIYFLHLRQSMSYAFNLKDIGHHYRQYRRLMDHWHRLYRDDILDFDYDAFVREPRVWTQKLIAFCGLDWDERCLSFHRSSHPVKTASAWQVREPLHDRSSGRWRHYDRYLTSLHSDLADFTHEYS